MQGKEIFTTYESEVRSYCRSFPEIFTKAKGSKLYDQNGKEYIDFFSGAGALNYGHNNDFIKKRIIDYIESDGIMHSLDMMTEPKAEFLDFFENKILKARGLDDYKVMFAGPTGANAVESVLKLARKVKKRSMIWAYMGCFHGMTLGALALTSDACSRGGAGISLENVYHVPAPYMFPDLDTIAYMQTLLDDDHSGVEKPAAIFVETVQADGGVYVFSVDYLKALREFCDKNDILMVVDDVQVGCARTGTFFSFERAGIKPDMFTLSKSIGGYPFPMALAIFKSEYDLWTPGEHTGTFRGLQLSMVAAKAGLEFMLNENIEAEVMRKGEIVREYLEKNIRPLVMDVRGIGLLWGIETENDAAAKRITAKAFENGLVIERAGRDNRVIKVMPPLTTPDDELLEGLEIIRKSLEA